MIRAVATRVPISRIQWLAVLKWWQTSSTFCNHKWWAVQTFCPSRKLQSTWDSMSSRSWLTKILWWITTSAEIFMILINILKGSSITKIFRKCLVLCILYLILIRGEIVAIGGIPLFELCISSLLRWLKLFSLLIFPYRVSLSCITDDPASEISNGRYWSMCCFLIFPFEFILIPYDTKFVTYKTKFEYRCI